MKRWKTGLAAGLLAGGVLLAGAATGGIDGPALWRLEDAKNPGIASQVNILGASGPYFVNLITNCSGGGGVTIIALNTRVTNLRNKPDSFRIDNNVKGIPAFMRIQAPGVGYDGRFEPTRANKCSLNIEVNEKKGQGRAKLDCKPGSDGFGMTPFPTEEQIEGIRAACASEKGVAISGQLKRVKVVLNGTAVLLPPL